MPLPPSDNYLDLEKLSANQITSMARTSNGSIYAVTANLGKLFVLGPGRLADGTYESDVYDDDTESLASMALGGVNGKQPKQEEEQVELPPHACSYVLRHILLFLFSWGATS